MGGKNWIVLAIAGFLVILAFGVFRQIINFNNQMISLQEMSLSRGVLPRKI